MSAFGRWISERGLPAFSYDCDHTSDPRAVWDTRVVGESRRHWLGIGNRRIQAFVDNEGTCALFDESTGLRWVTAPEPNGSGVSWIEPNQGSRWGTRFSDRPAGATHLRTFGPTWFRVDVASSELSVERTLLCPEGTAPWILVRVRLNSRSEQSLKFVHVEEWEIRPRFINAAVSQAITREQQTAARNHARTHVRYRCSVDEGMVVAIEERLGDPNVLIDPAVAGDARAAVVFGAPHTLVLEALGGTDGRASHNEKIHPTLRLATEIELDPGGARELWFRFGLQEGDCGDPESLFEASLAGANQRLPRAASSRSDAPEREIPWHVAILTGQACVDRLLGDHTLDQGSNYLFGLGINGAARDPLQHALPLIYSEPDLALSVFRNTLRWGGPSGKIPWCIDGAKNVRVGPTMGPLSRYQQASDLGLWSMWFASEYAAATGNLTAFDEALHFHPLHEAEPAPLKEHLRRQFEFLIQEIGFGPNGHLRVRDCDWADGHMGEVKKLGLDRAQIVMDGESVLNSAMAAWVLPIYSGLCRRLGDADAAARAAAVGEELRRRVAAEWNGRWFRRGRWHDIGIGDESLFLEVQPWAILCGAADEDRSRTLLRTIDLLLRRDSPLGARQRWPVPHLDEQSGAPGEALSGGIWPSLQTILIWAAARFSPEIAWNEWRRMTLTNHTQIYPGIWEGTLSGPDSYNAPESTRPGRTWSVGSSFGIQQFPVNNLHCHAQPVIAYLRLLGIEPMRDGGLRVAGGEGRFGSPTFEINEDGSGRITCQGPVILHTQKSRLEAGPGLIEW